MNMEDMEMIEETEATVIIKEGEITVMKEEGEATVMTKNITLDTTRDLIAEKNKEDNKIKPIRVVGTDQTPVKEKVQSSSTTPVQEGVRALQITQ